MKKNENSQTQNQGVFSRATKTRKKAEYKPTATRTSNRAKSPKIEKEKVFREKKQTDKKYGDTIFKKNSKDNLKIIPIGGIEEIGKNMTVFEYGDDIVIIDCGVAFPEDEMLGIDLVIPDFTYLEKNKQRIRGMVITHGHEDNIGSIPYFLKQINVPIYATKLTAGLITNKLDEHKLTNSTRLKVVNQGQTISLGKMKIEFITSNHSIPDAVALAIHTPVRNSYTYWRF